MDMFACFGCRWITALMIIEQRMKPLTDQNARHAIANYLLRAFIMVSYIVLFITTKCSVTRNIYISCFRVCFLYLFETWIRFNMMNSRFHITYIIFTLTMSLIFDDRKLSLTIWENFIFFDQIKFFFWLCSGIDQCFTRFAVLWRRWKHIETGEKRICLGVHFDFHLLMRILHDIIQ